MSPSRSPAIICRVVLSLLCVHVWAAVGLGDDGSRIVPGSDAFPTINYAPHPTGIPFTIQNYGAQPWHKVNNVTHSVMSPTASCSASGGPSGFWYEKIAHNGQSSFLQPQYKAKYKVFRNVVTDYGADNTGNSDCSAALQRAIEDGPSGGPSRNSHSMGTTGQPAIVYIPAGIYLMKSPIQLFVGTVLVGDPTNPPILKAAPGFSADHIVYAKDPNYGGTINFYVGIKNIVIDSTGLDANVEISLLDWTVSQATQLSNVGFNMRQHPTNHVGMTTQYDYNSNIIVNDLWFIGGNVGMKLSGQQWVFRNLTFWNTRTAVEAGGTDIVFLSCHFNQGDIGIDASGTSGSVALIDSSGVGLSSLVISGAGTGAGNAIILDNVRNTGNTVSLGGTVVLTGDVLDTWIRGDLYASGDPVMKRVTGQRAQTARSSALLTGGKFFTKSPPTYQEYSASQVLNIKNVPGKPVYGDGMTDDTQNINEILAENPDCHVIYFPAGTYIVTDTIFIPSGRRIIGDAYASTISAVGSKFQDAAAVRPMVQVGHAGDVGVAQVNDMVFTVADILPGCKLVEVNIAGANPGDVGFWNSHIRIGGAVGSQVETRCNGSPAQCKAAWGLLHLTETSSAYIENMWGWTADHDLDGNNNQVIATGRGVLVEATKGTWLVGTGFEHHTLYQYNFNSARNVFTALQQSETPYWQGPGNVMTPSPWQNNPHPTDPDWSQCAENDSLCRMALFERIKDSSHLFLYGGCSWVFFNNNGDCNTGNGKCQKNAVQLSNSSAVHLYGTNTKSTINMILEDKKSLATEDGNAGGWGGVIAAFLYNT